MAQKIEEREDGFSQVEKSLTAGEQFIEKNQKLIVRSVIAVLVILVCNLDETKSVTISVQS